MTLRPSPPRLVLVDRPDAPQSVIAVVRDGVAAGDPRAPLLDLVNTALGRVVHLAPQPGPARGARLVVRGAARRSPRRAAEALFVARAAVVTEATGPALSAMLADLDKMATAGSPPTRWRR